MLYCVNSIIVTSVTKDLKAELAINVRYGVMFVVEKNVRKRVTVEFVLTVTKKLDHNHVSLLINWKRKTKVQISLLYVNKIGNVIMWYQFEKK